jgi:hypothetical protein
MKRISSSTVSFIIAEAGKITNACSTRHTFKLKYTVET